MLRAGVFVATLGASIALCAPAHAHIKLKEPVTRTTAQKTGPCGDGKAERGSTLNVVEPGATITVKWDETIQHPGHFRILFDSDGDDFPIPSGFDDVEEDGADLGDGVTVLADDIADMTGPVFGATPYEQEVTLPDIECETCTLQVIQVMSDKSPYGDGNDLYFQCANLALRGEVGKPDAGGGAGLEDGGTADAPSDKDGESSCSVAQARGGRAAASAWVLMSMLLGATWLRRSRARG